MHSVGADDCWRAPTAGHDCGVTDESAAAGENALSDNHAVHVFWAGLVAHQDNCLAARRGGLGIVGGEIDATNGSARRSGETLSQRLDFAFKLGVQDLIQMLGARAHQCLTL